MDGFTVIDAVVGVVIIVSGLLAYARGFSREVMAILGWIGAALLAFIFADEARPLVLELIMMVPKVGPIFEGSCQLTQILAFAVVFTVAMIVLAFFTPLISSVIQRSALNSIDQGLGFLFGVARGILLVVIAFFFYETVMPTQNIEMVENSRSATVFGKMTGTIQDQDPDQAVNWLKLQFDQLIGACEQ